MTAGLPAAAGAAVVMAPLIGCGPAASEEALEWCVRNGTAVAREALQRGLMEYGTDYTDWVRRAGEDYDRACTGAYEEAFGPAG